MVKTHTIEEEVQEQLNIIVPPPQEILYTREEFVCRIQELQQTNGSWLWTHEVEFLLVEF